MYFLEKKRLRNVTLWAVFSDIGVNLVGRPPGRFWHCVKTHLIAPNVQTVKTSAFFLEVLTFGDDKLISYI